MSTSPTAQRDQLDAQIRAVLPFAARYVDRGGGIAMRVIDCGPAQPQGTVVFVHGNPTWGYYWRNLIAQLSTTHRCIAPDHVGMGGSDKPGDDRYPYTLAARVADLTHVMEELQPQRPLTLVVHDWGGMIGHAWAVQHADLVDQVVVLNTAAFGLPPSKPLPWALGLTRTPLGTLLVRGANAFALTATYAAMTRTRMDSKTRAAYLLPYRDWASRIATLRFVQDIPLRDGDPGMDVVQQTAARLEVLRGKLAIWWGGKDFVFDDHFLAEWRRRFPEAPVRYLADAGHYVLEDAGEVVPEVVAHIRSLQT